MPETHHINTATAGIRSSEDESKTSAAASAAVVVPKVGGRGPFSSCYNNASKAAKTVQEAGDHHTTKDETTCPLATVLHALTFTSSDP
jgi:hypothetical protein